MEEVEQEKNSMAVLMDKIFDMFKSKNDSSDVLNMLPKPNSQEIGDGIIVWRWFAGEAVVESILTTRNHNQVNLEKDTYVVTLQLPESESFSYSFFDESSREVAQALLSAWNWQHVWKLHAGDFLLDILSQEPVQTIPTPADMPPPERYIPNGAPIVDAEPLVPGTIEVDGESVRTTPTFDNE